MRKALAANPGLASTIAFETAGQQDPATQAIAAAQYMKDEALTLQAQGIKSPTALDTRAMYNFGGHAGAQIARASDTALISDYVSSTAMSNNNIASGTTVGQWRQSTANKMGTGANAPVLQR